MKKRASGILLHITSLPSPYGIGDLGPGAYRFADFLGETGQGFWEILPLVPVEPSHGNSPYSSVTTFAGNTFLISPDMLKEEGILSAKDLPPPPPPGNRVDYGAVCRHKTRLLENAFRRAKESRDLAYPFEKFCFENTAWLEDFALFKALKARFGGAVWNQWPEEFRSRHPGALDHVRGEMADDIAREKFFQFLFFKQWFALKSYCNRKGIQIIGDMPIYVSYDGAEAWTSPQLFKLGEDRWPCCVAGVPPDYFSSTGQRWGNPVYNWQALKESGYVWWIKRMEHMLALYDVVRIDHFRGLVAYWEIPAHEQTAVNGHWEEVPSQHFFNTLLRYFSTLPIIAEDLGLITPDVREVMRLFDFPGMKVVMFSFGEENPLHIYLPHMYGENFAAYTGTHDTNTARGWFEQEATHEHKARLSRYAGREVTADTVAGELMRLIMMSRANLALFPLQDVLGLGPDARMNRPSVAHGNWEWRLLPSQITSALSQRLAGMTYTYGRS